MSALRQWTVSRGTETFIFRYRTGDEARLLAEIADQAASGKICLHETDVLAMVSEVINSIPPGDSAMAVLITMDQASA